MTTSATEENDKKESDTCPRGTQGYPVPGPGPPTTITGTPTCPPPRTRSSNPVKKQGHSKDQSVKMSLLDESQQPRTANIMQHSEKPNRRQVLLITGITLLLLMIAGATAFVVITSNLQPVMDEETFTAVSGHKIQKREANDVTITKDKRINIQTIREEIGKAQASTPHTEKVHIDEKTSHKG